ncbi:hypothetical protein IU421_09810 [Nocardia cyriacigeorgica]|uniref:DUF5994 family protein n=1 Tax=Nocardia cyriacigeorgica TaxID=135487 RepID=UPI0018933200|nr:DUF5994 family protein [Nocardia cyriacigeorgica]MBF6346658.1 hypothetical protein [Nocardia cyriacigeorgica]MBF6514573.1 hypothetical protein [Nocardia cyriacigeorgica]
MTRHFEPILLERSARFSLRHRPTAVRPSSASPVPRPGAVDGAWWPHTNDLVAEIADLERLLGDRADGVDRIMYNLDAWRSAPRRARFGGHSVRLDGYRYLPADTVWVVALDRDRVVLLVIAPDTVAGTAEALLSAASGPGSELTAGELMADDGGRRDRFQSAVALDRWDDEGGHSAASPRRRAASATPSTAAGGLQ